MDHQDHIRSVDLDQLPPHPPSRWTFKSSKVGKISSSFTAFFFGLSADLAKEGIALWRRAKKNKLDGHSFIVFFSFCYK